MPYRQITHQPGSVLRSRHRASFPADKPDGSGFIKQALFRGTGPMITSGSQFARIDGCSGLFASSMLLVLRCC